MRHRKLLRPDFTLFMALVFMLAGCLLVVLISNVAVAVVDPATVVVSGVLRAPGPEAGAGVLAGSRARPAAGGNVDKQPRYVEVRKNRLVFYPGADALPVPVLAQPGNAFERLLDDVAGRAADEYIVLVVRPGTAALTRRLRSAITARGIDVGLDIYEESQPVNYGRSLRDGGKMGI